MTPRRVAVAAVLLFGLASLTWVHPWLRLLDPETRSARIWWVDVLQDGKRPMPWTVLFVDANGASIDPAAVTRQSYKVPTVRGPGGIPRPCSEGPQGTEHDGSCRLAAYPARPDLPTDAWGRPFVMMVDFVAFSEDQLRVLPDCHVWSSGPDGRFTFGGDDISFGEMVPTSYEVRGRVARPREPRLHVPFDTEPGWTLLALALGGAGLSAVGFRAPRSRRFGRELGLATCAAALPGLVAFFFAYDAKLDRALPIADGWLLVSPRLAAALCALLILWGAILAWRLRRPLPPDEASTDIQEP